ncbi:hypothetical protein ACO2Q9_02720 [Variovorax sp. VNK109]|uniref:hypothetical protein n=1 Tax=Variovorax sp. VNK109 TaxID=3400919 RepID=UPI003C059E31
MLNKPSFEEARVGLPKELQDRALQIEALISELIDACNRVNPESHPDIVLNALLSVYANAALDIVFAQAASENLVKASLVLIVEAANRAASRDGTPSSPLH